MTTAAEVTVPNPRFPGVEARHARECPATGWNLDRCSCSSTYRGTAWSRKDGRLLKSPPFASPTAAKNWAQDAKVDLRRGVRRAPAQMTVHSSRSLARAARRRPGPHPLRRALQAVHAD